MGTISSALNIITSALDADQEALNITANNVANASNESYTREVPNWSENQPIYINGSSYGQGVTVTGAVSQRDLVLNQRLDQQQQQSASSTALLTALTTLQDTFTPASSSSSTGNIGNDITNFFDAYSQLESSSTSNADRQGVLSAATTLAGDISSAAASINAQQSSLDQSAVTVVAQVNALTTSLAQVTKQIQSLSPNQDAGSLEDERQADLSQLSQLIGINQITTEQNGLSITTTGGQLLASEGASFQITSGDVNGVTHFYLGGTDITSALASGGGQLGGLLTARDQSIPTTLASLDQLAYGIATQVNTINNAGTDLDGDNGNAGNIFNAPTQVAGSAAAMQVVMTDPNKIAAAGLGLGSGDGSNATKVANLANQNIINGQTPSNFYSNLVSTLGATVSETTTENTALTASVSQLQTQVNSLSGVSLNDEASNLEEFQRSYQAGSEVFTILNTIMASAVNLGVETAVS
ncbi:flagellar hook-associated protein FlgK [Acidicapsa acidisoli]|uniref:flagellar hook-associated protein FlgK n=1 Tax=Acidicapsa acidisoli TaxID=1615681 RepID=UPI0021DF7589|nr:flagellar hook-associated protein FlgK [Acidicapsa acidisoli]